MAYIKGVAAVPTSVPAATKAYAFVCKCGCDLFRIEVETYADHTWKALTLCAACGEWMVPTEPMSNGPH